MAIEHQIRAKSGKTKTVNLTPLSAIRAHCLECMNWQIGEVKECASPLCPLYPFRLGKDPGRKGLGHIENLRESAV